MVVSSIGTGDTWPWYTTSYTTSNTTATTTGTHYVYPWWHDRIIIDDPWSCTTGTSSTISNAYFYPTWHDEVIVSPAVIHDEAYWRQQQEHQQAMQRLREQEANRQHERQQLDMQARARARELLLEHLTPEQRKMVEKNGWFVIKGGKSGKLYRVNTNAVAGNIQLLEKDKPIANFCCHLPYQYPTHDHHLAQKMMLEWDEDLFLKTANKRAA